MTDQGKEQQSGEEIDNIVTTRNFIEAYGVSLSVGLVDILRPSRIVLIGDAHTPCRGKIKSRISIISTSIKR